MFQLAFFATVLAYASAGFLHYGAPAVAIAGPAPAPIIYAAPAPLPIPSTQYKAQDTLGQYTYGLATGNGIAQSEARGITGEVAGGYTYTSPEGKQVSISYTAGEGGFQAKGDAIPKAPEPTAEVAEATKNHLAAKEEAAAKAAAAPEEPIAIAAGPIALAAPYAYAHHLPAHLPAHHLPAHHLPAHHLPAHHLHAIPAISYAAPHVKVLVPKIAPISAYSYSFATK